MNQRRSSEHPVPSIDPIAEDELHDANDASEVREEIGATLTALMPWGISILAHVGLIVIAFFLVWQTIVKDEPTQQTVPALTTAENLTASVVSLDDPLEEMTSGGAALAVEIAPVEPVEIQAVGSDFSTPQLTPGLTVGEITGPGIGPKGEDREPGFLGGTANDTVFLIDASGSMVDVLPFVINELKQVVAAMKPVKIGDRMVPKKATVIFFSGDGVFEVPGGGGVKGLRPLTPAFKDQIRQWVAVDGFNYGTGGRGNLHVEAALTRALSYKPELIILLSDNLTGGGQGATRHELMQDDLIELIHRHNKANPPTRINTIQFLYEDPLVRAGLQGTLDRIAEETGGKAKFVGERELKLR
jgi:hypothetical protein